MFEYCSEQLWCSLFISWGLELCTVVCHQTAEKSRHDAAIPGFENDAWEAVNGLMHT